jgi:predicted DCC family thiol-disulfide oxidoreductase YuxK
MNKLHSAHEGHSDRFLHTKYDSCWVIYDGDCPFCSAYVRLLRLQRTIGRIVLIDARKHSQLVPAEAHQFDLDEGMLLVLDGRYYHGADAINRLALLTGPSGAANKILYLIFKRPRVARLIYPFMRAGRNLTLRLLGRTKLTKRSMT